MAQKEYKELRCRDTGADCDFLVRAETEDEAIALVSEHACRAHNLCEITPEARYRMTSMTRIVQCNGECAYVQEAGWKALRGEWMED